MPIWEKLGHWGPVSSKLPYYPRYPKSSITQPSDCLGTWIRPHSMWNVMLKILNDFLCVSRHDLGYLGPVSPNCLNTQIPVKQV